MRVMRCDNTEFSVTMEETLHHKRFPFSLNSYIVHQIDELIWKLKKLRNFAKFFHSVFFCTWHLNNEIFTRFSSQNLHFARGSDDYLFSKRYLIRNFTKSHAIAWLCEFLCVNNCLWLFNRFITLFSRTISTLFLIKTFVKWIFMPRKIRVLHCKTVWYCSSVN